MAANKGNYRKISIAEFAVSVQLTVGKSQVIVNRAVPKKHKRQKIRDVKPR